MGAIRKYTKRHRWSASEILYLRDNYATAPLTEMEEFLGIPRRIIQSKANCFGWIRNKKPKRTPDYIRKSKREFMAKKRAQNIEAAREYGRVWRGRHKDRLNSELREEVGRRIFWGRALRLRGVTALDLWKLWKRQRGLCALSGRPLTKTAEIDHIIPKVRGGTGDLCNLRWVTKEANRAKRDLMDDEFISLCQDCARWVGTRIQMAEDLKL